MPLKPGQYVQGALATVFAEQRVYVVTVPPPVECAGARPAGRGLSQGRAEPRRGTRFARSMPTVVTFLMTSPLLSE